MSGIQIAGVLSLVVLTVMAFFGCLALGEKLGEWWWRRRNDGSKRLH